MRFFNLPTRLPANKRPNIPVECAKFDERGTESRAGKFFSMKKHRTHTVQVFPANKTLFQRGMGGRPHLLATGGSPGAVRRRNAGRQSRNLFSQNFAHYPKVPFGFPPETQYKTGIGSARYPPILAGKPAAGPAFIWKTRFSWYITCRLKQYPVVPAAYGSKHTTGRQCQYVI